MKKGTAVIKTEGLFTLEDIDALLGQGQFSMPYALKDEYGRKSIRFEAKRNSIIEVMARRKKITVSIEKDNQINDIGLSMITEVRQTSLENSIDVNLPLLDEVTSEICRLTGGELSKGLFG